MRSAKWILWAAVIGLVPGLADAHLVTTGFGTYYDGLAHFFITPSDLLVVVGLGLLAGLTGLAASRRTLLVLTAAWLVGGIVGMWVRTDSTLPLATTLSFGLVGVLVAFHPRLSSSVVAGLGAVAGAVHGYVNGATMIRAGMDWLSLVGAATAVFVVVTILAAVVVSLRAHWAKVVVRVAGSWLAAIAMLMIGWWLKGSR